MARSPTADNFSMKAETCGSKLKVRLRMADCASSGALMTYMLPVRTGRVQMGILCFWLDEVSLVRVYLNIAPGDVQLNAVVVMRKSEHSQEMADEGDPGPEEWRFLRIG